MSTANLSFVRLAVTTVINRILGESGRETQTFSDEDFLTEKIGLDSLDFAVMVVGLEQSLGVDPFRVSVPTVSTFGALVALYESELKGKQGQRG
jgi:acyl carrier protein